MPALDYNGAATPTSNPYNSNQVCNYLLVGQGAALIEAEMLVAPRYARLRRLLLSQTSPRQADVLLVAGPVNLRLRKALLRLSRQLAAPYQILEVGNKVGLPDPKQSLYTQTESLAKFLSGVHVHTALQDKLITPPQIAHALHALPPLPAAITTNKQATEGPGDLIPQRSSEDREMATEDLTLSLGPLHPAIYGPLRLILTLDGEQVVAATADSGYAHRGLEKAAEGHPPAAVIAYGAALDGLAPLAGAVVVAQALEAIMLPEAAKLSKRAIYLRVIALELERIASHLFTTARLLRTLNLDGKAAQVLEERAKVVSALEIFIQAVDNAAVSAYIKAGGVRNDLTPAAFRMLEEVTGRLRYWTEQEFTPPDLFGWVGRYAFESRLKGLGIIDTDTALEYCLSGPNLRASGIKLDVRTVAAQTNNYNDISSVYQELGFEPIVVKGGDAFSRYHQRIAEIAASTSLIKKALKRLPAGSYQYKLELDELKPQFGMVPAEASSLIESPRGLLVAHLALTLVPGKGLVVERLRLRTPSWAHYSLLPQLLVGERLDDALVVINSLDIAPDEAER